MPWSCPAIDHGVTIFPNGKIGPCCQIDMDYVKPMSELDNPDRFSDLKTERPPSACASCVNNETAGMWSYRKLFESLATDRTGIQFLDIRNTNVCNLKCRYCGPHFSNKWADELGHAQSIVKCDISDKTELLISDSLHWMYFTGGEPMMNPDHWQILEVLIEKDLAKNIQLLYNTNLTTLKYKDKDIRSIWKHFKRVEVQVSVDGYGEIAENIRSGMNWNQFNANLFELLKIDTVQVSLTPVISILNIWEAHKIFEYATTLGIDTSPILLHGPDYLGVDVVPGELKPLALESAEQLRPYVTPEFYNGLVDKIKNNINQVLFGHTVQHVLLLDKLRNENLFGQLPFLNITKRTVLE